MKTNEKIPLPNNPYKLYPEEKNGRTYYRAPFPNYIAQILGIDSQKLSEEYEIEFFVNKTQEKIEIDLQRKND